MSKRVGIVNINLEFEIPESLAGDSKLEIDFLEEVALPRNYISGSFEIVKIINED